SKKRSIGQMTDWMTPRLNADSIPELTTNSFRNGPQRVMTSARSCTARPWKTNDHEPGPAMFDAYALAAATAPLAAGKLHERVARPRVPSALAVTAPPRKAPPPPPRISATAAMHPPVAAAKDGLATTVAIRRS